MDPRRRLRHHRFVSGLPGRTTSPDRSAAYITGSSNWLPVRAPRTRNPTSDRSRTRCAGERSTARMTRLCGGGPSSEGRNHPVTRPRTAPAATPVPAPKPTTADNGQLTLGAVAPRKDDDHRGSPRDRVGTHPPTRGAHQPAGPTLAPRPATPIAAPSDAAPPSTTGKAGAVASPGPAKAPGADAAAQPTPATATVTSTHRRARGPGSQRLSPAAWSTPRATPSIRPPATARERTSATSGRDDGSPTSPCDTPGGGHPEPLGARAQKSPGSDRRHARRVGTAGESLPGLRGTAHHCLPHRSRWLVRAAR